MLAKALCLVHCFSQIDAGIIFGREFGQLVASRLGWWPVISSLAGLDLLLARSLYLEAATLAPLGEGDNAIAAAEEATEDL